MAKTARERMSQRYGEKDTPAPKKETDHPTEPTAEKAKEGDAGDMDLEGRHATERKMMASRQEGERRDMHNTHRDEHRAMEKRHDGELAEAY